MKRFLEAAEYKNICYNTDKSDRVKPLAEYRSSPLSQPAGGAFESLKKTAEEAVITAIYETIPFEEETDASDVALVKW